MMRRFSIRSLMAFVLVSAVGLAAFRNAGDVGAGMLLLASLAAVGMAVLGAVIMRGGERCWWAGFAFFGGGYLAIAVGPWLSDTFQQQIGTTQVLVRLHEQMHPSTSQTIGNLADLQVERDDAVAALANVRSLARSPRDPAVVATRKRIAALDQKIAIFKSAPTYDHFQRVGHSLFAILAGLVGGTVATWFYTRRESRTAAVSSLSQRDTG
jgi:hypothetical protein